MRLSRLPILALAATGAMAALFLVWHHGASVAVEIATTPARVEASRVFWNPEAPQETRAGGLTYIGGLELDSDDDRFGGLSGFLIDDRGSTFLAVTDTGYWVTGLLETEADRPVGLSAVRMAPMLGPDGAPYASKRDWDAESLTLVPGASFERGPVMVGFERNHRVARFHVGEEAFLAREIPLAGDPAFSLYDNNGGLEALLALADGSLLAFSESALDGDGNIIGVWLREDGNRPLRLKQHAPYALTDLAQLPDGDLVTLERRYSPIGGVGLLMRRIPSQALETGAPLDGEVLLEANSSWSIDNMEGLDIRIAEDGTPLLYLVSDDNFNPLQRTLLLVFALEE